MNCVKLVPVLGLLLTVLISGCRFFNKNNGKGGGEQVNMHVSYDDSTLNNRVLPIMMPYNRIIDPAGKVIRFGDPQLENHSLDAKLIPGTALVAVEDRYGVTLIDTIKGGVEAHWSYNDEKAYKGLMSTYSGLQVYQANGQTEIFWSAADGGSNRSCVMHALWNGHNISLKNTFDFKPVSPAPLALPNELAITTENDIAYLYVVLNGNNQLVKINLSTNTTIWTKPTGVAPYGVSVIAGYVFVTNWGGTMPNKGNTGETAGVPYGDTYINPKTGAASTGTVQVMAQNNGSLVKEIPVGLHPNVIIASKDSRFLYVADANSDKVSVISAASLAVVDDIPVKLVAGSEGFIGDSPNALAINDEGSTLYVANGLDNAVAVVKLGRKASANGTGKSAIKGFIPTEAYPGGLLLTGRNLFVTNLEGEGSRVSTKELNTTEVPADVTAYNSHHERATVSLIPLPDDGTLKRYTAKVEALNLTFREK